MVVSVRSTSLDVEPDVAVCAWCGDPRPEGFDRYCTRRCKERAARSRWRARRRAAGRPVGTPWRSPWSPYNKFVAATKPDKRVQVPETPEQQRNAELLIARGCCAYRNRAGLIRDLGVPRKPEHRGKVWTAGGER